MPTPSSPVAPGYTWSERAGRYRSPSGRFVSGSEIRAACQDTVKASEQNMLRLTGDLRAGDITLAEWQTGMMREVKTLHIAQATAARGGWAQMSQADYGRVGAEIKKQYQYLDKFAIQLENGTQPLNGRVDVRARMYAQAGRDTYETTRRNWQRDDNGMTEERRVRSAAESCGGCIEQSNLGWQPIGTLDPIGEEECRVNCQCHFEYRKQEGDKYVYSDGD